MITQYFTIAYHLCSDCVGVPGGAGGAGAVPGGLPGGGYGGECARGWQRLTSNQRPHITNLNKTKTKVLTMCCFVGYGYGAGAGAKPPKYGKNVLYGLQYSDTLLLLESFVKIRKSIILLYWCRSPWRCRSWSRCWRSGRGRRACPRSWR